MPNATLEILMSLFWHPCLLGSLCSWCTWPLSQSLALASTLLGALVQPSFTTGTKHGMTIGYSGLDHLQGQH
nr:Aquaporin PIP2-6 [Ipomoea batatas]GMC98323.1 Aquaporin PIP2-6 [Ipomoea batatas]